jgi:glycosyltransferase involved in cell wall biosynthesis
MQHVQEKVWVVIPVYNEGPVIKRVINKVREAGYSNIIVVNDGSTDQTREFIKSSGCMYVEHKLNRGKGAALRTGIAAALSKTADVVVTMDGDGQHDAHDLPALVTPVVTGQADVVLGTRFDRQQMPPFRVIGNGVANTVTRLLSGLAVHDSQSGFRAFSRRALVAIKAQADDYAFESETIQEIRRRGLTYTEVPIRTIYTRHSRSKNHGQGVGTGLATLAQLLWKKIN